MMEGMFEGIKVFVFDPSKPAAEQDFTATCGHEDIFGSLTGLPCGECVDAAHKKAVGR